MSSAARLCHHLLTSPSAHPSSLPQRAMPVPFSAVEVAASSSSFPSSSPSTRTSSMCVLRGGAAGATADGLPCVSPSPLCVEPLSAGSGGKAAAGDEKVMEADWGPAEVRDGGQSGPPSSVVASTPAVGPSCAPHRPSSTLPPSRCSPTSSPHPLKERARRSLSCGSEVRKRLCVVEEKEQPQQREGESEGQGKREGGVEVEEDSGQAEDDNDEGQRSSPREKGQSTSGDTRRLSLSPLRDAAEAAAERCTAEGLGQSFPDHSFSSPSPPPLFRPPSYRAAVPHPLRSFSPSAVSTLPPPHQLRHEQSLISIQAVHQQQPQLTATAPCPPCCVSGPSAAREVEDVQLRDEWRSLLSLACSTPGGAATARVTARELVWRGVPRSLRGEVWMLLLAHRLPSADLHGYMQLMWTQVERIQASSSPAPPSPPLSSTPPPPLPPSPLSLCFADIEKDVSRTLPSEWLFRTPEGVASLRRLLLCFAVHCPRVGYCQGLNFIAGSLLLATGGREVEAFALLCAVVDAHRTSYYTRSMAGCMVDTAVMADLAGYFEPELLHLLSSYGLQVSNFCSAWFICLFCHAPLALPHAMRVWDVLFCFGDEVLFRLGLALLRHTHRRLLLVSGVEELLHLFLQRMGDMDSIEPVLQHMRAQWTEEPHLHHSITALRRYHRYEVTAQLSSLSAATISRMQEMTEFDEEELQRLWELFIRPRPWQTLVTSTITSLVHFRYSFIAATFHTQASQRFIGKGLILASTSQQPQRHHRTSPSPSTTAEAQQPPSSPSAALSGVEEGGAAAVSTPSPSASSPSSVTRRLFSSTAGPGSSSPLSAPPSLSAASTCTAASVPLLVDEGTPTSPSLPPLSPPSVSSSTASLSSSAPSALSPSSTMSRLPLPSSLQSHAALFVVPHCTDPDDSLFAAAAAPSHTRQRSHTSSSPRHAGSAQPPASSWSAPSPLSYHSAQSTSAASSAAQSLASSARCPFPSPSTTEPLPSPPSSPSSRRSKGSGRDRKAATLTLPSAASSSSTPLTARSSCASIAGRTRTASPIQLPSTFSAHRALSASLQTPLASPPPTATPAPCTPFPSFHSTIPLHSSQQQRHDDLGDDDEREDDDGESEPLPSEWPTPRTLLPLSPSSSSSPLLSPLSVSSSSVPLSAVNVCGGNVLARLFAMLDGSGRGCVDFDEFCVGVAIWKRGTRRTRLMAAFRMADVTGRGGLSREELRSFISMLDALYHGRRCNDSHVDAFVDAAFEKAAPSDAIDLHLFALIAPTHPQLADFFKL